MTDFFAGIPKIRYEGPETDNEFAFRHYNPDEVVMGKRMEDHLRFAVAYWHSFAWPGGDPFGGQTFEALGIVHVTEDPTALDGLKVEVFLNQATTGLAAADAVLLRRVDPVLPNLHVLDLQDNPLDNRAHEIFIPQLEARAGQQNLVADEALAGEPVEEAQRPVAAPVDGLGRDHLRVAQRGALPGAERPERRVGVAGHGGEEEARGQERGPERERFEEAATAGGQRPCSRWRTGSRTAPRRASRAPRRGRLRSPRGRRACCACPGGRPAP